MASDWIMCLLEPPAAALAHHASRSMVLRHDDLQDGEIVTAAGGNGERASLILVTGHNPWPFVCTPARHIGGQGALQSRLHRPCENLMAQLGISGRFASAYAAYGGRRMF